ncbi:MAG: hypothetical protein PVSMB11_03610 [Desulfuromonadaceae bacterium]
MRGHLYVEASLNRLISLRFLVPKAFDLATMHYPAKVDLAVALGMLGKDELGSLRALNTLRNRLAHNIEHKVTEKEVRQLLDTMSPTVRAVYKDFTKMKPIPANDHLFPLRCFIVILSMMLENLKRDICFQVSCF